MDEPKRSDEDKKKDEERDEQSVSDMDVPEKDAEEATGGELRRSPASGVER